MPSPPDVPAWFTPGDPWLTDKMRCAAEVAAAERRLGPAIEKAVALFLQAAHTRLLQTMPATTVTAQAGLDDWPDRDTVWRSAVERFVVPVLRALFTTRFRRALRVRVTINPDALIEDYLDAVWAALRTWPDELFAEVHDEYRQALAGGLPEARVRQRLADLLSITAPNRRAQAEIDRLRATIADPDTKSTVRRAARARLSVVSRRTDRSAMRWWPLVAELARAHAVSVLNAAINAAAEQDPPDDRRYKIWLTALDNRVRPAHHRAHGQVQPVGDMFTVGGFPMRYPGDPVAPPDLRLNCRCSLRAVSREQAEPLRAQYERQLATTGPVTAAGTAPEEEEVSPVATAVLDTPDTEPDITADAEPDTETAPVRWRGVVAPLDKRSPDGRVLATPTDGAPLHRTLPLPLLWQERTAPGHDDAVIVGNITRLWTDAGKVMAEGTFDPGNERAREVVRQIRGGYHRWVSVTHDPDAVYTVHFYRGEVEVDPAEVAIDTAHGTVVDDTDVTAVRVAHDWRLSNLCLVAEPAFDEATLELVDYSTVDSTGDNSMTAVHNDSTEHAAPTQEKRDRGESSGAAMDGGRFPIENRTDLLNAIRAVGRARPNTDAERATVRRHIIKRARALGLTDLIPDSWNSDGSLTASTGDPLEAMCAAATCAGYGGQPAAWCERVAAVVPLEPPAEWFTDPQLTGPVKIHVSDDGRVFGHIAPWNVFHASFPGVTAPPAVGRSYAKFHRHAIRCADDSRVKTGPLAGRPHANIRERSVSAVMRHYDDAQYVVADVVVGEDEHGIWASGALRPGVTPFQVLLADRYSFSGDWRNGELLAACASVIVPGFHLDADDKVQALAASAAIETDVVDTAPLVCIEDGEPVAMVAGGLSPVTRDGPDENPTLGEVTVRMATDPEEWGRKVGYGMLAGLRDAEQVERDHADALALRKKKVDALRRRMQEPKYQQVERLRERMGAVA